jgi:hypothetical protein
MKRNFTLFAVLLITTVVALPEKANAQFGRVLINEYMPWPGNACGTTSEFVELFNMGPGPVNIGCYVISDGDFSVTIPANTILLPGQFYLISGQSLLFAPCANFTKNVVPDLNWTTCNCSSAPIPTINGGFLTDGGFANEQVVFLSPTGQVVDAVQRDFPGEPSNTITTKAMPGCSPYSFNLDFMGIEYETVGESTGRGNSIARKLDGDCGWVKDTQQTGSETNNTPGARSSFTLSMFITEDLNCTGGTARFVVDQVPAINWFPLDYILGFDSDGDGQFTFNDTYTTGMDFTTPDLIISNLTYGLYAINIGPRQGCSYQNFRFAIGPCTTLGYTLHSFELQQLQGIQFRASISGGNELAEVILEGSYNGRDFFKVSNLNINETESMQDISYTLGAESEYTYFRLMLVDRNRKASYSQVRKTITYVGKTRIQLAGNPVMNQIRLFATTSKRENVEIQVFNSLGQEMYHHKFTVTPGTNLLELPAEKLQTGLYFVKTRIGMNYVETLRVIKQ